MSNLKVNQVTSDRWTGSDGVDFIPCRAIVQYTDNTTATVQYSQNVSSLTDNGTGDVTINFLKPMPNAYYAVAALTGDVMSGGGNVKYHAANGPSQATLKTASQVRLGTGWHVGVVTIAVFV